MRVAATGDLHLGLQRYGVSGADGVGSRIRDFEQTLGRFVVMARDENVALACLLGDVFNSRKEGPHERAAFAAAITALREAGIVVVVVSGNHDGRSTVGASDSDSMLWLDALQMENVHVFLDPTSTVVDTADGPVRVTAVPYPHRRSLDVEMADVAPSDRVLLAGGRLEKEIGFLASEVLEGQTEDTPRLFIGHLTVIDSIAGSETAMKMGWDVAVHRRTLAPFDLSLLGHIHKFQRLGDVPAWYTGSPEYIDFTEAGLEKGFVLADFERGERPEVRLIPSGARPMINLGALPNADGTLDIAGVIGQHAPDVWQHGPIVRVEIHAAARPDPAEVARLQQALMGRGASFVKTEIRLPERPVADRRASAPDPELDLMGATERWLGDHGVANIPAVMATARQIAAGAD